MEQTIDIQQEIHNLRRKGFCEELSLSSFFYFYFLLLQVDGYARLFGIFKEVRMLVTSDSLQMYLTTEVNKSFKINVHVTTNYSSDRNQTQFNATVVFDNGLSKVRGHTLKLYFQSFFSIVPPLV